jgi:nucleotide-binding universal stress UspA family protein
MGRRHRSASRREAVHHARRCPAAQCVHVRTDDRVRRFCMMRWAVGIDLLGGSSGALRIATWMRDASAGVEEFVGVHVDVAARGDSHAGDSASLSVDAQLLGLQSRKREPSAPLRASSFAAPTPAEGLALALATLDCDALLLGDGATTHRTAQLGRTARETLRHLPAPSMIVPRQTLERDADEGPLMLATDLGPSSVSAGRLARSLATSLHHDLAVVHVDVFARRLDTLTEWWFAVVPRPSRHDVERWVDAAALAPADVHLVSGSLVDTLLAVARDLRAPVVVCGSRSTSPSAPLFLSSTASELALRGERPVLVVPP